MRHVRTGNPVGRVARKATPSVVERIDDDGPPAIVAISNDADIGKNLSSQGIALSRAAT